MIAFNLLIIAALLTLTGTTAALWHMAWWIGVAFFAMVLVSLGLVIVAIVTSQPPNSEEAQKRKKRPRKV